MEFHRFLDRNHWLQGLLLLLTLSCSSLLRAETLVREPATINQTCRAMGTVGFHDYDGAPTLFHPTVFNESTFQLEENRLLAGHLTPTNGQSSVTYLTLVQDQDRVEFECKPVRLSRNAQGMSCVNQPPTTMLLVNPGTKRYTRSNIAAWTFSPEQIASKAVPATKDVDVGESMFIEHGTCTDL